MLKISKDRDGDKQLRSYLLGFVLLNRMGEDFVRKIFANPPPEWRIRAETEREGEGFLSNIPFFGQKREDPLINYFAYGPNMLTEEMSRRLGWLDSATKNVWNVGRPKKAILHGYRLVFGKATGKGPLRSALATVVPDPSASVEGVVYELPESIVRFLDTYEKGYRRIPIKVNLDGKTVDAQTYKAEVSTKDLPPSKEYLDIILSGAQEHDLSANYLLSLTNAAASTSGMG
jgi:hypothetical protein